MPEEHGEGAPGIPLDTERRIRAHIFVCVLALQVERWMRNRLRPLGLSVPRALALMQRNKVVELVVGATSARLPT